MATVYSYIRFSTPQQLKGDSLRRQLEATEAFCRDANHTLSNLTLRDLGVSAFRGRNATSGGLAKFRDAISGGRVQPGSILAVENLDRLSRDQVTDALQLLLGIISAGVTVYTTMDRKTYSIQSINANPTDLMFSILVMMRGHEESLTKSKRTTANWQQKRKLAAETRKPITSLCPTWMNFENGEYRLIPERVKILKQICKWTTEGHGISHITRRFNREEVPTFSRKGNKLWEPATVRLMTTSRSLIGEYQPFHLVDGKWQPVGDPIPGYYPAALTDAEFYMMQNAVAQLRGDRTTRNGPALHNLFGTLVRDEQGRRYMVQHVARDNREGRKKAGPRQHLVVADVKKTGEPVRSFPYPPFERGFLTWVVEVADKLQQRENVNESSRLEELQARLTEIITKLRKVQEAMLAAGGDVDGFLEMVPALSARKKAVAEELEAEKARRYAGQSVRKGDVTALVRQLEDATGDERLELRAKLKAVVHSLVREIRVYQRSNGMTRLAVAHVTLMTGESRFFAVRTQRGEDDTTFSDGVRYDWFAESAVMAEVLAARLADRMAAAKTVEGMQAVWSKV